MKRKRYIQSPKKEGCPAKITMKEVLVFQEYRVRKQKFAQIEIAYEMLRRKTE